MTTSAALPSSSTYVDVTSNSHIPSTTNTLLSQKQAALQQRAQKSGRRYLNISVDVLATASTPLSKTLCIEKLGPIFFGATFECLENCHESFSQTSMMELFAKYLMAKSR